MNYTLYANGFYHSEFKAKNKDAAVKVAKTKSRLFGGEYYVTLYDNGGAWLGDYYCGCYDTTIALNRG